MKRIYKIRTINGIVFLTLFVLATYEAFFSNSEATFTKGGLRGVVIFIPCFLLALLAGTIYYTRKSGGNWAKVRGNIKRNFLNLLSFTWEE